MLNQPKVLVVDSDKNILSAFKNFLSKEHCNLIPVTSINEVNVNVILQRVDLLIIDINQKLSPDVKLFSYVRKYQKGLPIIIITSYPDVINEKDAKNYGANYFFVKPLDLNKFRDAVKKCLQLSIN